MGFDVLIGVDVCILNWCCVLSIVAVLELRSSDLFFERVMDRSTGPWGAGRACDPAHGRSRSFSTRRWSGVVLVNSPAEGLD